jgi:hypothetical protein
MLALVLAGGAVALDLAGSARIAGGVLLAGRGEGLCELVDLVLDELGGEDETCGGVSSAGIGGRGRTWLGERAWRVAVLHDKRGQKLKKWSSCVSL